MSNNDVDDIYFSENLLMLVLLPPIVFSAALKINKDAFRLHSIPIFMYATLGTLLSAFLTGFAVFAITNANDSVTSIPLLESLIFGALISSIDPVVILNIFENVGITDDDTLYIVLFGESILNDALAIVLFDTLVAYLGERDSLSMFDHSKALNAISNFLFILIGSLSLGLLAGICSNLFFYCISGTQSPVVEVSIFSAWAMIPYYVCNLLDMSGIVALVAAGFFMDMYVIGSTHPHGEIHSTGVDNFFLLHGAEDDSEMPFRGASFETFLETTRDRTRRRKPLFSLNGQLSEGAKRHTAFVAEVISSVAETCIFAYLGAFLFSSNYIWGWKLNVTAIVACIGSRAVMITFVSCLTNVLETFGCTSMCQRIRGCCRWLCCASPEVKNSASADSMSNIIDSDDSVQMSVHANSSRRITIDCKMQLALIFAGLRGAVSLALVQSVPLYNAMTKTGTLFKPELKTMTSTAIIFTVFVFGGLTHKFLACLGILGNRVLGLGRPLLRPRRNYP